jgi:hypothetical protein
MRFLHAIRATLWLLLAATLARGDDKPSGARPGTPASQGEDDSADRLSMTKAIACRSIDGYEDYEPLPKAELTADEKLLVYYHPRNYRVDKAGGQYHVHLTQDGQVRRRGEKPVLLRKLKLLDYEFKMKEPPNPVFLRNTIALKGLKPGEYDFDIILHDELAAGAPVAIQTLPFRVIPAVLPNPEDQAERSEDQPAPPPKPKSRAKRSSRATAPLSTRP